MINCLNRTILFVAMYFSSPMKKECVISHKTWK